MRPLSIRKMPSCGLPWLNSCAPRYSTRRLPEPNTCAISVSVSPLNKYGGPLRCAPPSVISSAPNCAGAPAFPGADAGCGVGCLPIMGPLEAKLDPNLRRNRRRASSSTAGSPAGTGLRCCMLCNWRAKCRVYCLSKELPCPYPGLSHFVTIPRFRELVATATIWPIRPGLVNIARTPPLISDEPSREQAFEIDRKKPRPHLYRHRWLDLRAVARGVLSRQTHAGEGVVLRRIKADLDRDQRHLLRFAEAREFSQMGA